MISFIYLGFIAPILMVEKGQSSSVSGNNAELNFVGKVLSKITLPENIHIVSYQYNIYRRKIYGAITKEKFSICEEGMSIHECYPIRTGGRKFASKVWAFFDNLITLCRIAKRSVKNNEHRPIIMTVNTFPMFAIPAIVVGVLYKLELATYLIDGYYNVESQNPILKINAKWASRLLRHYDYVIALCQNILDDYGTCRQNSLSITPVKINDYYEKDFCFSGGVKLFFAGGVAPLNGIREYIDAMSYLSQSYSLDIYGTGELTEYVKDKAVGDHRIRYCGIKNNEEIRKLETTAHILMIVRSSDVYYNSQIKRYGIPYKVLEYLQSGTPIISSEIDAVPNELRQFINICEPNGKSIAAMVEKIADHYDEYKSKALLAREYMKENCTWEICKERIQEKFDW